MEKTKKEFDTVSFFRFEKEKIAKEIVKMDFEELNEYLKSKAEWIHPTFPT